MSEDESRLRVRNDGDVTRVEFIDRNILDEMSIQSIGDELASIIEQSPQPKLLVSFHNVDHLSSAALGTLITINTMIRNRQGQLRLADIDPQIKEVFAITKLDKLFRIHETSEDALQSFV